MHFQRDHFACNHPDCVDSKFVVFATEIELKSHHVIDCLIELDVSYGDICLIDLLIYVFVVTSTSIYRAATSPSQATECFET